MSTFARNLNILLEDNTDLGWNPAEDARQLVDKIDAAKQLLVDLQNDLSRLHDRLTSELALGIHRGVPGLNVAVDDKGCSAGYKDQRLDLTPNLTKQTWMVMSPDAKFANQFNTAHADKLPMSAGLPNLLGALIGHFNNHFNTVGEDIVGTGVLLIEGRKGTLIDLVRRRGPRLPSRRNRISA